MKQNRFFMGTLAALLAFGVVLTTGCDNPSGGGDDTPAAYKGFHNYPAGREDPGGTLKIFNPAVSEVLLFYGEVSPAHYIGTVGSTSNIKVKLPEEKFYTIVAVDKNAYEERGAQAVQYSSLTYYSNRQPYELSVQSSYAYGGGSWIINNFTNYWVSFRKSDQSGTVYAVVAPNAKRVEVPVQFGVNYDFTPRFYRELKYDGKVIALVEFDQDAQANTVAPSQAAPQHLTDIQAINVPSENIQPAILVKNNSDKTIRVYQGQNNQLSNGVSADFALPSGYSQLFTGLTTNNNTTDIQFYVPGLTSRVVVSESVPMAKDKVYLITLNGSSGSYTTTVNTENASTYFN